MKFDLNISTFNEISNKRPRVYCKDFIPLQEGAPAMLFAGGGMGKSYASIRIAIEFSLETGKKSALWLTEDTPGENRFRFDSICGHFYPNQREQISGLVKCINSEPARFTKLEGDNAVLTDAFWYTRLHLNEYGLVVIDPLIQFNGGNENSNTHAGIIMGAIKTWAHEENKCIVLIHHVTIHDGKVKARGAGEWSNACRAVYLVSKPEGMPESHLKFTLTKNNGIAWCFKNQVGELSREIEIFPPWDNLKEQREINLSFISVANHNKAQEPKGFEKTNVYFRDLHNYVIGDCAYSPFAFRNSYRKGENNEGGATIICLDFDSGMTIEEARKMFFRYDALIVTTRSHQKEKGSEAACDRYRVFLNLRTPLDIPTSEYGEFFNQLYGIFKHVDPSTKDIARFYFASPLEAQYWYSESSTRFDWEPVYEAMKRQAALGNVRKRIAHNNIETPIRKRYGSEPSNTLPEDTIFSTKNGSVAFATLRNELSIGQKITCRCREDIDHGGLGHNHHSAFIQKADNGNVFYSCSGGRCASVGTLWCAEWNGG